MIKDTKDEEATKEEKEHGGTAETKVIKEENEDPLRFMIGGRGSWSCECCNKNQHAAFDKVGWE